MEKHLTRKKKSTPLVYARVTKEVKNRFQEIAEDNGHTISSYLRFLVTKHIAEVRAVNS